MLRAANAARLFEVHAKLLKTVHQLIPKLRSKEVL